MASASDDYPKQPDIDDSLMTLAEAVGVVSDYPNKPCITNAGCDCAVCNNTIASKYFPVQPHEELFRCVRCAAAVHTDCRQQWMNHFAADPNVGQQCVSCHQLPVLTIPDAMVSVREFHKKKEDGNTWAFVLLAEALLLEDQHGATKCEAVQVLTTAAKRGDLQAMYLLVRGAMLKEWSGTFERFDSAQTHPMRYILYQVATNWNMPLAMVALTELEAFESTRYCTSTKNKKTTRLKRALIIASIRHDWDAYYRARDYFFQMTNPKLTKEQCQRLKEGVDCHSAESTLKLALPAALFGVTYKQASSLLQQGYESKLSAEGRANMQSRFSLWVLQAIANPPPVVVAAEPTDALLTQRLNNFLSTCRKTFGKGSRTTLVEDVTLSKDTHFFIQHVCPSQHTAHALKISGLKQVDGRYSSSQKLKKGN